MRFPDRRFTTALLRRAVFLWFGVRLLVALAGGGGVGGHGLLPLAPQAAGLVVLLVGFLGVLEARRRNEHLLLANFGVPEGSLGGLSVLPAIIAETIVRLIAHS
jgi:hypothetical protein